MTSQQRLELHDIQTDLINQMKRVQKIYFAEQEYNNTLSEEYQRKSFEGYPPSDDVLSELEGAESDLQLAIDSIDAICDKKQEQPNNTLPAGDGPEY